MFQLAHYFFNAHALPYFIAGLLVWLEGLFVFVQNRRSLLHASFMLCTISTGVWLTGLGLFLSAKTEPIALLLDRRYCFLGVIFIAPSVYLFSVCWRRLFEQKWTSVLFHYFCGMILSLFSINSDLFIQGMWKYPWGYYTKAGTISALFPIWFSILMAFSIRNFVQVYHEAKIPIKKRQARLILIAFSIASLAMVDFLPDYGIAIHPIGFLPILVSISLIGYSIIRHHLLEIETVIHKTLAWFLTSLALIFPLAGLLDWTKTWSLSLSPLGRWAYWVSVLLAFLIFVKKFHPKIDHFFHRARYDQERVLNQFSEDLVRLRSLQELVRKISDTLLATLYPGKIDLFVYDARKKRLVHRAGLVEFMKVHLELDPEEPFLKWLARNDRIIGRELVEIDPFCEEIHAFAREYFQKMEVVLCIPLVVNERLVGLIHLGRKLNLNSYNALDYQFLNSLKNQSAIAISNSLSYQRVEEMEEVRTEELIEAQRQLIQAEKLATLGTLASEVAHEINNPLAAIMVNAQMMLLGEERPEEEKESLRLIESAAQRTREIVKKLMRYSRKTTEESEMSQIDLKNVIQNVLALLAHQMSQENIRVYTNLASLGNRPLLVKGYPNELEQVLTNLLLNSRDAIKSIKPSGQISIRLSETPEKILLEVTDDGVGIPREHLAKVFDPFFTTKEAGKGTGLGLSICQRILSRHGGSIQVQSEPGRGTIVTLILPNPWPGALAPYAP